ncbi:MAG: two-component system sensor histidine kinase NtrB [Thermodesulfobacteriota bacterium]
MIQQQHHLHAVKIILISILCCLSIFLTYYFRGILGVRVVYTHFYYIPIILSALWWQRKGLIVAILLSLILIASDQLFESPLSQIDTPVNNYMRMAMFLLVSIVVVSLSEQIEKSRRALKDHGDRLEELVRIRTGELEEANRLLKSNLMELEAAHKAVRSSESQVRKIIENSPVGIRIAQNGRYVYVNPKLVAMFGYAKPEDIIGRPVEALFVPEQAELIRSRGKERVAGNQVPVTYELQGVTRSGSTLDLAVWLSVIDYQGAPAILGFIVDIGLEKKLRQQIFQTQKMESMGVMAGGIAHKFNNALSLITGSIDLVRQVQPDTGRIQQYLDNMLKAVEQMAGLNRMLIAFSRQGKYWTTDMLLNSVIRETAMMIPELKADNRRIEFQLTDNLPNIRADHTQVQMVVTAVLRNAMEATGRDGRIVIRTLGRSVTPETAAENPGMSAGEYVCLVIEDNGAGMDEQTRRRVFEPFFTTHFQGRGLGMAAVYGIVKNHGGWVGVESQPGKGTVVTIFFPLAEGQNG